MQIRPLLQTLSLQEFCICITAQCRLQPDPGPCEALTVRYFWNSKTRQCEEFNYGGCEGNPNRFLDQRSCENQCGEQTLLYTYIICNTTMLRIILCMYVCELDFNFL